jgi:mono/diheme cytochrome c family protein
MIAEKPCLMTNNTMPVDTDPSEACLHDAKGSAFFWALVAATACIAMAAAERGRSAERAPTPYRIIDGTVDEHTYNGFRRYNAVCSHCHGADAVGGSFAPSLIAVPLLSEEFRSIVLVGRRNGTFVMPGYADDPNVTPHIDDIYSYLRARADGALERGRPRRTDER